MGRGMRRGEKKKSREERWLTRKQGREKEERERGRESKKGKKRE